MRLFTFTHLLAYTHMRPTHAARALAHTVVFRSVSRFVERYIPLKHLWPFFCAMITVLVWLLVFVHALPLYARHTHDVCYSTKSINSNNSKSNSQYFCYKCGKKKFSVWSLIWCVEISIRRFSRSKILWRKFIGQGTHRDQKRKKQKICFIKNKRKKFNWITDFRNWFDYLIWCHSYHLFDVLKWKWLFVFVFFFVTKYAFETNRLLSLSIMRVLQQRMKASIQSNMHWK